ncbi:DNA-binding protein [Sphingobacterium sp. SGG-5]|uniref:HU family DNA-binding protein n=1 Tax=Sphingobacterium sp. SGG-5 TaxID=2710881 RepID=UPI0013EB7320|nr:HU family DNA-binding protein [Sphingobacterium sp. SGG-5]NGM61596.1 DNA-binding protein [Sphingobacterium sp. SGG-5]
MAMKFNVIEIANPMDPEGPKKFYARPVHTGEVLLEDLASDISYASSINESDVYAVLQSLIREITRYIALGYIVRLGNMGSFRLGYNSKGSDTEEEVSAYNIQRKRLLFSPGKRIKDALTLLTFKKNDQ